MKNHYKDALFGAKSCMVFEIIIKSTFTIAAKKRKTIKQPVKEIRQQKKEKNKETVRKNGTGQVKEKSRKRVRKWDGAIKERKQAVKPFFSLFLSPLRSC